MKKIAWAITTKITQRIGIKLMNARIVALLAIMTAFASLVSPVQAQSSGIANQDTQEYKITGDSLTGINNRDSQQDYQSFFEQKNPAVTYTENQTNNITAQDSRLTEALSAPNSSLIFVPVQSFNGNDGTQVQFDFGNSQ
ncbi:hypothetical protein H6G33_12540 [Calothrix sp. FACHB-1219]|uniref:hypothetical protein n=1 Tax=unclassified Calothrix TaxID=2619626 RepID=UPI0016838324|nr:MULTISPECIES: hypothetical protein [unclassified Calothrix]MBD2202551.1 hypothetical protein [Calothrix sp. FACHB-168]MBD2217859.1 hypothetical protein [Calothrix sp. FACHB-1219]